MAVTDNKQTIFTTILAVSAISGVTYISAGRPSYILQGQIYMSQTCDAGICPGTFVGVASSAMSVDAGTDAGTPDTGAVDTGIKDSGPLPPTDAGSADVPPPTPDSGPPPPMPDAGIGGGILDPNAPTTVYGIVPPGKVYQQPVLAEPAVGASYKDPVFGTTIRRMPGESDVYSQLQAFSPDNMYYIAIESGDYTVRKVADGSLVQSAMGTALGASAPRWQLIGHKLFYITASPTTPTASVQQLDLDTKQVTTLYASPDPFAFASQTEEAPSLDGQWTTLWTHDAASNTISIRAVNMNTGLVGATLTLAAIQSMCPGVDITTLNWVAPSPLGNYLVLAWTGAGIGRCQGMELYDIQTGTFLRHAQVTQYHSDLGLDVSGREIVVTVETDGDTYQCTPGETAPCTFHNPWNNGYNALMIQYLDGQSPPRYVRLLAFGAYGHVSLKGPKGFALLSGSDPAGGGPLLAEVGLVNLATGDVLRLADHRSSECDYWEQSKATLSADGRLAAFASDWNATTCARTNSSFFLMQMP